jgi:hypothetical protein
MNRITLLLIGTIAISGCSQFTTNSKELTALQGSADAAGESYVACVKANGLSNANQGAVDFASSVQLAVKTCQTEQDAFRQAQEESLGAQMMLTGKPVEESVAALNKRASNEIAEELLAGGAVASAPQTAVPAGAAIAGVAAGSAAARAASTVATPVDGWSAEQRIYLDCVADEAVKYAGLEEGAATIAEVVENRCSSYLGPPNAALQQEARAVAMGAVMDARLKAPPRESPESLER